MRLKTVQINHFKHVLDSTPVEIQPDITCLVGKNESGKTAFLEALRRLKPAQGGAKFSSPIHYPAWLEKRHRRKAKDRDLDETSPVTATFALEEEDAEAVAAVFGEGVLLSNEFEVSRKYTNKYGGTFKVDEAKAVANLLAGFELPNELEPLNECKTFNALRTELVNPTLQEGEESNTSSYLR